MANWPTRDHSKSASNSELAIRSSFSAPIRMHSSIYIIRLSFNHRIRLAIKVCGFSLWSPFFELIPRAISDAAGADERGYGGISMRTADGIQNELRY